MMIAKNPRDVLQRELFERFRDRDRERLKGNTAERKVYWSDYTRAVAGLPVELRQCGLLATIAMRFPANSKPSVRLDILCDLIWSQNKAAKPDPKAWMTEIYSCGSTQDLMRRQAEATKSAEAIKIISGMRKRLAEFEHAVASEKREIDPRNDAQ